MSEYVECYENLKAAVVKLAADDYRRALIRLRRHPKDTNAIHTKIECELFFRKGIETYSNMDGEVLIKGIQERVGGSIMNREQLNKYKKNKRDIENLDGIIAKLQERLDAVPVVSGKVTKSSDDFPYIEEHVQVRVEEPKAATALKMRICEKEKRKDQLIHENEKVEKYIAAMPDGTAKDIFEMVFLDGMTQKEVGESVGYTQSMVSKVIKDILKHS